MICPRHTLYQIIWLPVSISARIEIDSSHLPVANLGQQLYGRPSAAILEAKLHYIMHLGIH